MPGLYNKIYEQVKQIPEGMVTTYGILAMVSGNPKRSRIVGTAMANCKDNTVPCHRVIKKDGSLSDKFGIGGSSYQRFLLEKEGVKFTSDGRVQLSEHLYIFE